MSLVTSPILLDSTGQDINETLKGIQDALLAANTLIDDESTAENRVWSSKKITDALTVIQTDTGNTVICSPIAATPIIVSGYVEEGNLTLTQSNGTSSIERQVYVPATGHFTWTTGALKLENGETAILAAHAIKALKGTNTFTISAGTIDVKYHTIGTGTGSSAPAWDVIFGGSAAEEV